MTSRISAVLCVTLGAALLVAGRGTPAAGAGPQWPPVAGGASKAEAKVRMALDDLTKLEFDGARLDEVLEYLKELHGIQIVLEKQALEEINITGENLVTMDVNGISLRSALKLMLRGIDPTLVAVVRDEVLTITTQDAAEETVVERIYDVSALLNPDETARELAASLTRLFRHQPEPAAEKQPKPAAVAAEVPAEKPAVAQPEAADNILSGPSISAHRKSLLVRGTEAEHESVLRLLRGLKEQADAGN